METAVPAECPPTVLAGAAGVAAGVAAGAAAVQRRLTGGSREARLADAVETSSPVQAAATVQAGLAGAVVQTDGAETSDEAEGTQTREAVDAIHAGGASGARHHQTVVYVGLTELPSETSEAETRQLCGETLSVFTLTAIFTWRPAGR